MRISDWSSDVCSSDLFDHGRAMVVPLSVSMMAATIGGAYLAGWIFIEQTGIDAALITAILAVGWLANLATSTEYFMLFGHRQLRMLTMSHIVMRSEEHTSELQSLMRISYAVFCLKKKKNYLQTKATSRQTKNKRKE